MSARKEINGWWLLQHKGAREALKGAERALEAARSLFKAARQASEADGRASDAAGGILGGGAKNEWLEAQMV